MGIFAIRPEGNNVTNRIVGSSGVRNVRNERPPLCLLFERKCQSFDLALMDNRPEIQRYYWDPQNWTWPVTKKPDLIFFGPPYFSKKERDYEKKTNAESPSISSYTKEEYESFLEGFLLLAHRKSKAITSMALLNADWRDFESTPASKEKPDKSITIFDYHRILTKTGWKVTHLSACGTHRQVE